MGQKRSYDSIGLESFLCVKNIDGSIDCYSIKINYMKSVKCHQNITVTRRQMIVGKITSISPILNIGLNANLGNDEPICKA